MLVFSVPSHTPPLSLKDFLRKQSGISLTSWRKLKQSGTILVNNIPFTGYHHLQPGDVVTLTWPEECHIEPVEIPLKICYEDDYLLIIDKPAGMLVHPVKTERTSTVANAVLFYFKQKNLPFGFHPVHRLDRNTSGLLLIAKYSHVQHLLSGNHVKKLHRTYQGIVSGQVEKNEGFIDVPIARHPDSIIQRMVHEKGQPAQTHFQVLQRFTNATLLEISLLTGRTHQIRVHCSYIGHPLLGDDLYGGSRSQIQRQALHSSKLSFLHPINQQHIELKAALPPDMNLLVNRLKESYT